MMWQGGSVSKRLGSFTVMSVNTGLVAVINCIYV